MCLNRQTHIKDYNKYAHAVAQYNLVHNHSSLSAYAPLTTPLLVMNGFSKWEKNEGLELVRRQDLERDYE
jgi:hypothetical protein